MIYWHFSSQTFAKAGVSGCSQEHLRTQDEGHLLYTHFRACTSLKAIHKEQHTPVLLTTNNDTKLCSTSHCMCQRLLNLDSLAAHSKRFHKVSSPSAPALGPFNPHLVQCTGTSLLGRDPRAPCWSHKRCSTAPLSQRWSLKAAQPVVLQPLAETQQQSGERPEKLEL